ncbi:MAG TPA: hypothetical protein VNO30_42415 [Kofleriaceae bacterium]|nr:hypothetical protein [Kofleriaceae bacterium]
MDIRFGDHASFHRAAAGMALGSLLAGIALHFITGSSNTAPLLGGLAGLAAGAAWGYGKPIWRVLAAGLAAIPLLTMALQWPALAICAAAMALGLAVGGKSGATGLRGALAVGAAIGVLLLAMWCSLRVDTARQTEEIWQGWWIDGVAAAAMGIVGAIAVLPRHITLVLDAVRAAQRRLPATLDPEVRHLCDRAIGIWGSAKERLTDGDPGRELVRDGVLKTLEVAVKSASVRPVGPSEEELASRMADLDQRIAAATDAEVKAQYTAARAALDDQRRYREHIANGRERLVARLHNHIAALEKFQLAATGLVATRAASSGSTAVQQLEELSSDVAASGEALAELELGEPAQAAAPAPGDPETPAAAG